MSNNKYERILEDQSARYLRDGAADESIQKETGEVRREMIPLNEVEISPEPTDVLHPYQGTEMLGPDDIRVPGTFVTSSFEVTSVPSDSNESGPGTDMNAGPSEESIYGAAQTGIIGPMADLWERYRGCQLCPLSQNRTQVVLGSGNPIDPTYVFVGQAPAFHEDQNGRPFVGPAGEELTKILNEVGINRVTDSYLMNAVCCRPIDPMTGRVCPPQLSELAACRDRFGEQLKILVGQKTLKVIVLLGKEAWVQFFEKSAIEDGTLDLDRVRVGAKLGWQDMSRRRVPKGFPKVYFTYHPSYILRRGGQSCSEYTAWESDFEAIVRYAEDGLFTTPRGTPNLV